MMLGQRVVASHELPVGMVRAGPSRVAAGAGGVGLCDTYRLADRQPETDSGGGSGPADHAAAKAETARKERKSVLKVFFFIRDFFNKNISYIIPFFSSIYFTFL